MTEQTVFPPRALDADGRCCGRKPMHYKTTRGMGVTRDPHYFCTRCDAEFDQDGKQRANWAWLAADGGFVPKYPTHEYVAFARPAPAQARSQEPPPMPQTSMTQEQIRALTSAQLRAIVRSTVSTPCSSYWQETVWARDEIARRNRLRSAPLTVERVGDGTPYSSVVGQSLSIISKEHGVVALLMVSVPQPRMDGDDE